MIDFRYHLVSLVAVFLALAVGVVLGSGPLRQSIGAGLGHQVDDLRAERTRLRAAVAERDAGIAQRDAVLAGVAPRVVAGALTGVPVVLVVLPGAPGDQTAALGDALTGAGAVVTGRVAVQPAWVDPARATFRRTLSAQVVPYLEQRPSADAGVADELAAALAQALLAPATGAPGAPDPRDDSALELLRSADLVAVDGARPAPAAAAVVVGGPGTADGSSAGAAAPVGGDWLPLAGALDARGTGTVVAAPRSAADRGGLLAVLRAARPQSVSTVDSADTATGRITTVLALVQQRAGGSGQYGSGAGAAPLPPLPGA